MEQRDVVIVGGGPAGLTAGLYASRARLDVALYESLSPGGQMLTTDLVENWPGDVDGVNGWELSDRMRKHAEKFGLIVESREVLGLSLDGGLKIVKTGKGDVACKSLIIASGAQPRPLGIPGEQDFIGKGVSFCGTCDGAFFRDAVVAAIGGGNTAAEEAVFLTRFAKKVYMIHRRDELRADGILAERAMKNEKIEILWSHQPLEVLGDKSGVKGLKVKDLAKNEERGLPLDGVFVFVGTMPRTGFWGDLVETDEYGFIIVNHEQETNLPGVYAAGDCCNKLLRQIVVAAGEGALAAYKAQLYLEDHE
jgi:thioredoxin reductase (NADPH)